MASHVLGISLVARHEKYGTKVQLIAGPKENPRFPRELFGFYTSPYISEAIRKNKIVGFIGSMHFTVREPRRGNPKGTIEISLNPFEELSFSQFKALEKKGIASKIEGICLLAVKREWNLPSPLIRHKLPQPARTSQLVNRLGEKARTKYIEVPFLEEMAGIGREMGRWAKKHHLPKAKPRH